MPRFDPTAEVATSFEKTPGRWLVKIPRQVQVKKDGPLQPGINTIDNRTGTPRRSTTGHEMWDAVALVIDDHAEAPHDAKILGIHLTWGGKALSSAYALLKALGHPIEAWKRETDPAKVPEITPELFYDRPFVLDTELDDRGYLAPKGFMPYFPKDARRGPAPAGGSGSGGRANGGGGGGGGSKPAGGAANPGLAAGHPSAGGNPDSEPLPF